MPTMAMMKVGTVASAASAKWPSSWRASRAWIARARAESEGGAYGSALKAGSRAARPAKSSRRVKLGVGS